MNLKYIANIRLPTEKAHGVQIMKMCEAFTKAGHSVELVITNRYTTVSEDPFEYYSIKKIFKIKKLWCFDSVSFGNIGYRLESLSFFISAIMYSLFKGEVFYTRDEIIAFGLSVLGKKVYWEAHMGHPNVFSRFLLSWHVPVIVISNGLKDFYIKMGAREDQILVSPDAVDLEEFNTNISSSEAKGKLGLDKTRRVAMYIGLLDEWKGYRTLLESSQFLTPGIQSVIVGGTPQQVDKLRLEFPSVNFLGFRPYTELAQNQRAADVLVIPNSGKELISKYFTSPLKLFAHMNSGVPIVASDLPSIREIVDESSVYFCEPDNPKNLAAVITKVLQSPEDSSKKSLNAKEEALKYTWDNRAKNILKFMNV